MPKSSGQSMKTTRAPPKPQPSRKIMKFAPPAGPRVEPMAMGAPKIAADLKPAEKEKSGSIDPRQVRF